MYVEGTELELGLIYSFPLVAHLKVMATFNEQVTLYEGDAKYFIDSSFRTLRSAEGAFCMLQNFKHIRTRQAISDQLQMKYQDVLAKFCEEVEDIEKLFLRDQEYPNISRNQPPVAGSIRWAYSLFLRTKETVLRFQEMPELLQSEPGKLAIKKYATPLRCIVHSDI